MNISVSGAMCLFLMGGERWRRVKGCSAQIVLLVKRYHLFMTSNLSS